MQEATLDLICSTKMLFLTFYEPKIPLPTKEYWRTLIGLQTLGNTDICRIFYPSFYSMMVALIECISFFNFMEHYFDEKNLINFLFIDQTRHDIHYCWPELRNNVWKASGKTDFRESKIRVDLSTVCVKDRGLQSQKIDTFLHLSFVN